MSAPRTYEWYRNYEMLQFRGTARDRSFDLGAGTLIRLIYTITYMGDGVPASPWNGLFFTGCWAISDVAPDPLATGVDGDEVLERHTATIWNTTSTEIGTSEPWQIEKDMAVRRTLGATDLLWWSVATIDPSMEFWWSYQVQALILRP